MQGGTTRLTWMSDVLEAEAERALILEAEEEPKISTNAVISI
jgi:hypothetical protein